MAPVFMDIVNTVTYTVAKAVEVGVPNGDPEDTLAMF